LPEFVTSDGVRLSVLEAGAAGGSPVVAFVPGWTMPAFVWRGQMAALAPRFRVAALDPRGQGDSELAPSGYGIDRRADDIAQFIARYPRVVLVGWSLAALEALHCVHRHGEGGIAGLVLVDSPVGQPPPTPDGGAFRESLRANRAAAVSAFVRAMFRTPRPEPELLQLERAAMRMPLDASLALFPRELPREHWKRLAEGFSKPLMYVVTAGLEQQAAGLRLNRPATRVEVFEQAGHALFLDEPERFSRLIGEFAGSIPA
jgi:non-heme chloroperoxidase